ncbi:hypothetical protein [Pseudoalteromonas sp. PAR1]|uniref:hypothetical protein n=1 Tax=Pseudoalteromonas sp. PAR1 TaxID=2853443 RepID=UPI00248C5296|nr:hypothetical protein [Pseudoalteromonas sp. PAR1]
MLSLGKGLKALILSNLSVMIISVITGVIIARILSVEERGVLASVYLWVTLSVSVFGDTLKEYCLSQKNNHTFFSFKLLLLSISLSVALSFLLLILNQKSEYLWYAFVFSILNILTTCYLQNLQSQSKFLLFSKYKAMMPLFYFLFLLFGFYFEFSLNSILFINLLANFLVLFFISRTSIEKSRLVIEVPVFLQVFISVFVSAILMQFERVFISTIYSSESFAYFMIASTIIVTPITILFQALSNYLIVEIKNLKPSVKMLFYIFIAFVFFGVVFVPISTCFLKPLVTFVFGDSYSPAEEYVLIAGFLGYILNVKMLFFSVMRGEGLNQELYRFHLFSFFVFSSFLLICFLVELDALNSLNYLFIVNSLLLLLFFFIYLRKKYKK